MSEEVLGGGESVAVIQVMVNGVVRDATEEEIAEIEARVEAAAAPPTEPEYVAAVQAMLDTKARERKYDGILSACTYVTSTNTKFQAEGQACVEWRDAVWAACYELMGQVTEGTLSQPTVAELLAMLPEMEWPV
jgi:hypothetical protein